MSPEKDSTQAITYSVIDVYSPIDKLVWVYISQHSGKMSIATERKIQYSQPPYLKNVKLELSHLVAGEDPWVVFLLLKQLLEKGRVGYIPFEIFDKEDTQRVYRFALHEEDKDELKGMINNNLQISIH